MLAVAAAAMLLGLFGSFPAPAPGAEARAAGPGDGGHLLSSSCPDVVHMGQRSRCVRELQILLARAGGRLEVDGAFGPITRSRVVAFQLHAGLEPDGAVGGMTKRALYDREVRMPNWPPGRVEQRIREVFTEDPGRAVGVARCHSSLDPLLSQPTGDGAHAWGVFQLSERVIRQLGGTRIKALSPEWNIRAAHRLWKRTGDFRAWACGQAYRTASPSPSAG